MNKTRNRIGNRGYYLLNRNRNEERKMNSISGYTENKIKRKILRDVEGYISEISASASNGCCRGKNNVQNFGRRICLLFKKMKKHQ